MKLATSRSWEMGHRLPTHAGLCRHLHGHHYVAEIEVEGPVLFSDREETRTDAGMVADFAALKAALDGMIREWDHAMMLWRHDPKREAIEQIEERVVVMPEPPTAETIATAMHRHVTRVLDRQTYRVTRVRVSETPGCWAEAR